jgi:hypothetical protein
MENPGGINPLMAAGVVTATSAGRPLRGLLS